MEVDHSGESATGTADQRATRAELLRGQFERFRTGGAPGAAGAAPPAGDDRADGGPPTATPTGLRSGPGTVFLLRPERRPGWEYQAVRLAVGASADPAVPGGLVVGATGTWLVVRRYAPFLV